MNSAIILDRRGWIELTFVIAGLSCFATGAAHIARYDVFEHEPQILQSPVEKHPILERLLIPRLGLSVAILEGDTEDHLALGAAHVNGTAPVGARGNAAIAGHRDSAFRGLGAVSVGDKIIIQSAFQLTYRVTRTRIVAANDVSVLRGDERPRLTLITCYPFHFIGKAPQRFIVEAEML